MLNLPWTQKNGKAGKKHSSASKASKASFTTIDFHMGLCQYSLQMVSKKDAFDQALCTTLSHTDRIKKKMSLFLTDVK